MKAYTLRYERITEFERNPKRIWFIAIGISIFLVQIVAAIFMGHALNSIYGISIFLVAISLFGFTYKNITISQGECTLEFNNEKVLCKNKNSALWSIPFSRISHIESKYYGTGKWFLPRVKDTYIFTNDNDSYIFPGALSQTDQESIETEIEAIKNRSA